MKNKLSFLIVLAILSISSSAFSATPGPECTFHIEKAPDPACDELLLKIEYVIANLASATYDLIELQRRTQYHPHLEFSKSQQKTIAALDTYLYQNKNFDALARVFKFNKQDGISAALLFFEKIASIIGIELPSTAGLVLNEQKYDWLKNAARDIKKAYKKFKPGLKNDEAGQSLKRAIIFNPVTRHIPLAELAKVLSSEYSRIAQAALTASIANRYGTDYLTQAKSDEFRRVLSGETPLADGTYSDASRKKAEDAADAIAKKEDKGFFKTLKDEIASSKNLRTTGAVITIQMLNQMLSDYLQSLAKDKAKYEEREKFSQTTKEQKKMKGQMHGMISHAGTGAGFKTIKGIQDDKIITELAFLSDWLKKPISYPGNKLAVMLYGPPGNGKGIITKALSDESKTPMISISADDVATRKLGEKLWAATQIAKDRDQKSVIVFFDEIDLIVPPKNPAALQSFLTFLDGTQAENPHVRILYIFATNHIEKLDPRMLRPGRFKSKIHVGPPNLEQRAKLITMSLMTVFKFAPADLVEKLAVATDGLSRVAIDEAIENTYNHAALTDQTPGLESFLEEIEKLKEVNYHTAKQVA